MAALIHHVNIHDKHFHSRRGFAVSDDAPHTEGMKISDLRKARSLTQIDLAEMTASTQPTISRAENMDDGATLGTYKAIAAALNVPLADLFTEDRTKVEQALLDAFRRLSPDRQRGWLDMATLALGDQPKPNPETEQTGRRSSEKAAS